MIGTRGDDLKAAVDAWLIRKGENTVIPTYHVRGGTRSKSLVRVPRPRGYFVINESNTALGKTRPPRRVEPFRSALELRQRKILQNDREIRFLQRLFASPRSEVSPAESNSILAKVSSQSFSRDT